MSDSGGYFRSAAAAALLLVAFCAIAIAQGSKRIPEIDRARLAEAFNLSDKLSEKVWPGWGRAPFAVLLVTPDEEFLIRHPAPSPDFVEIGYDKVLKSKVFRRPRKFDPSFLATFPAIEGSGVSTIVVGEAENTWVKTSMRWVITILHEHFHQLQDSQPGIYVEIAKLDLSGGDQTGMWMLNYPFPYSDKKIGDALASLGKLLAKALDEKDAKAFKAEASQYLKARRAFNAMLSEKDHRYLSFQIWKEGTARYIEYKAALAAESGYTSTRGLPELKKPGAYRNLATELRSNIVDSLSALNLAEQRREIVYPFGAGEALLLDRLNIGWHPRYFAEKFYWDRYFDLKK